MIDRARQLLEDKYRILVFTGAGLSTASGIPDFRGPDGVWNRLDPSEFTYQRYVADPGVRKRAWTMRSESGVLEAKPNAAHRAVAALGSKGRLEACVTQNIDGLHQRAGLGTVIELHGTAHSSRCLGCDATWPTTEILARVGAGDSDPHCRLCGSIIKASVVSFGEQMPVAAMDLAFAAADACDAVIAAGSTLGVYPAAEVPLRAARRGVPYIVINQGETEHDAAADLVISGDVTEVFPELVASL